MKSLELVILTVVLHFSKLTLEKLTTDPHHKTSTDKKLNGSFNKDTASFSPLNVTDHKPPIFSIKNPAVKATGKIPHKIFTTAFPKMKVTKKTIKNSLYRFGPASHNVHALPTKFKEIITLSPNGTAADIVIDNLFLKKQAKGFRGQVSKHRNSLTVTRAPQWRQNNQFRGQNLWSGTHQNRWQHSKPVQQFPGAWQSSRHHNQLVVPKNQGVLSPFLTLYNPWKTNPTFQQGLQNNLPANPSFPMGFKQKYQPLNWAFYQPFEKNLPPNNPQSQHRFMPSNQHAMAFGNTWQNNWRQTFQPMMTVQTSWQQFSPPLSNLNQQPTQEFPGTWQQIPGPHQSNQFPWENTIASKPQQTSKQPWKNIPVDKTQQSNRQPWKGGKMSNTKVTVSPKPESESALLIKTVNNMTASVTKFITMVEKIITTLNGLTVQ